MRELTWGQWLSQVSPAITAIATILYVAFTFIVIRQNMRTQRRIEAVQQEDARIRVLDRSPIIEPSDSVLFRRKRKNVQAAFEDTLVFPLANPTQYPATDLRVCARADGWALDAKDGTDVYARLPSNLAPDRKWESTFLPGTSVMTNVDNGTSDLEIDIHWKSHLGVALSRSATYRGTGETRTVAAIVGVGPMEIEILLKLADMGSPEVDLLGY